MFVYISVFIISMLTNIPCGKMVDKYETCDYHKVFLRDVK